MTKYYIKWESDRRLPALFPRIYYCHEYINEEDSE